MRADTCGRRRRRGSCSNVVVRGGGASDLNPEAGGGRAELKGRFRGRRVAVVGGPGGGSPPGCWLSSGTKSQSLEGKTATTLPCCGAAAIIPGERRAGCGVGGRVRLSGVARGTGASQKCLLLTLPRGDRFSCNLGWCNPCAFQNADFWGPARPPELARPVAGVADD